MEFYIGAYRDKFTAVDDISLELTILEGSKREDWHSVKRPEILDDD